jgi:hypothetical protein
MRRVLHLVPALALAVAACGATGDTATPIDCKWLEGANCWKDATVAATSCIEAYTRGTFDAATTTCTYPDAKVNFAVPASTSYQRAGPWRFQIDNAAGNCMTFEQTGQLRVGGMILKTSLGTFTETAVGSDVVYACPDGRRYRIDAVKRLECSLSSIPGWLSFGESPYRDGTIGFALTGSTAPYVFMCRP